ncbi:hypothetical protein HG535_0F06140 [Zygotorulaspora mrakii]|uniref:Myb-like DNA-binding protein BAS1 n=1 Tax=Zygotorulaspora mrakii TaxID=42260 RepID=A0A7H9B8N9_ZYGMR|nr:uncharacterized protein HG535_0F06140 [Zygotorulaspora mrakii]QLG74102.1 hypothetical protein HG535_0F06140 [Zygotorulaspora mrakii]
MEAKLRRSKVKKTAQIDPLDITESLGYKTHRKNGRNSWSKEDDEELRAILNDTFMGLGYKNGIEDIKSIQESELSCTKISWEDIAVKFKNGSRKPKDLRKRWTSSLDPNLKKGKWASEEDTLLMQAYKKHGPHWLSVAEEISGRTEDQCAKRYIEILGPSSEGRLRKWTLEEDLSLVSKVKLYGTRWRRISSELEFRPSLTCRNRWRKLITSVVRGRAPPEIVKAVKEKQELDLMNESLKNNIGGLSNTEQNATVDLISVEEAEKINYEDTSDDLVRRKLQDGSPLSPLADSKEKLEFEETKQNSVNLRNFDNTNSATTSAVPQFHSDKKNTNNAFVSRSEKEELNADTVDETIDSGGRVPLAPVKDVPAFPARATLLEDSFFGDRSDPQPPADNRHVGHLPTSRSDTRQDTEKLSLPHAGQMEWKFILKDGHGLSLSSGTVASSELVKELIDQARKYSLKISIHQHIHNHYGQQPDAHPLQSAYPDNLSHFRAPNISSMVPGGLLPHTMPDFFNTSSEFRTASTAVEQPADNDFLSQTPTYNVFGLEPSPQPDNSHLSNSSNFFQKNQSQSILVQANQSSPNYPGKTGTNSSTGSRSSCGDDVQDIGRNRVSHFNYLPATVKPQLGSSDSTKATDLSKLLNPSPANSIISKRGKKNRKNGRSESPYRSLSRRDSSNTPPVENNSRQQKSNDTPGTASSINEEEGLDFWESLRSLAGGPVIQEDGTNTNQRDEEDYHLFYGLLDGKVEQSDHEELMEANKSTAEKSKSALLPFNPS